MSTQIEIINQALIRVGANIINALDEGSIESTITNEVWDTTRKTVMRAHPWNFAIKEQELARVVGLSSFEFDYGYQLPSDFLRLVKVFDQNSYRLQGKLIYTNSNSCKVKYIRDVEDPNLWDASFTDVVAARLAFELCYPLTKSTSLMGQLFDLYTAKLGAAQYIDASEDISDPIAPLDSSFISVRF